MTRSNHIIAAIVVNLLLGGAYAVSATASTPTAYATYQVRLEISRNGIYLGAPESTVANGESASLELNGAASHRGAIVQQRVTGFPGASDYKALLELELYGQGDAGSQRIVAPTFGVELGRSQVYELPTDQGLIRILARVDGLQAETGEAPADIQTTPYTDI